jgi:ComF family protein
MAPPQRVLTSACRVAVRVARRAASWLGHGLLDSVMPQTCVACGHWTEGERGPLCGPCAAEMDRLARLPACGRCGRIGNPLMFDGRGCGRCRRERFWNIAGLAHHGPYRGLLERLITGLKFGGDLRCAEVLGRRMADAIARRRWEDRPDVLVPVPMHTLRRMHRPLDHAHTLAAVVGRRLRIPVQRAAVRRVRHGPSQTGLDSSQSRFENVLGCFAAAPRADVSGRVVCIVDNLVVSGATIYEVSKVLRKAGARRIYAVVAATAMQPAAATWLDPAGSAPAGASP